MELIKLDNRLQVAMSRLEGGCPDDGDDAVTSCATAARSVTRAGDPTFHGQLRVTVLSDQLAKTRFGADIGVYYTAQGLNWLVCSLESTSDRSLLNSVAGVENGPLPFE